MICSYCKRETSKTLDEICAICYAEKHPPTKTLDKTWLYLPVLRKKRSKSSASYGSFDSELAKSIIQNNFQIDDETNQIQINNTSFPFTIEGIDELAKQSGVLVGKWLIYRGEKDIDASWKTIAEALIDNMFGVSAKVSTVRQKGHSYVICVYTQNYMDTVDVQSVRSVLSSIGFRESLCYKPDLYTYLNIYSGTSKIQPCRFRL